MAKVSIGLHRSSLLWTATTSKIYRFEETFGGQVPGEGRVCQCHAVSEGPLVVPSNKTRLISADNVSRSSARAMSEEGRFVRSQPYSDDFKNGVRYDYASMHAGARLVTHAKGLLHAKAVLSPDKSLYMLSPCETRSWFVISLLEDIFVEYVGLVTLELFASGYRHVQILGSNQYPTEAWRLLGELETNATSNYELFDVGSRCQRLAEECWVRFLKIRVLSHHRMEDNSFCALTRFQVFGATATNYIAKERTAEDRRDRRLCCQEVARAAALPPSLGRESQPSPGSKDSKESESEEKFDSAKSLTDLISCLNTMLALVVQLFTEQSARMKTLEERSNEGPPEVSHSWPIERPLLGNDVRKCGKSGSSECPEEELNADVRDALLSLWEQLQVLLYYPLDVPWDRILLIIVSIWLLLSRISSALGRSSVRMTSPEVEVHEVNPTPRRSNTSKGSSRHGSAKKDRDDTNRTVSGASGRRLQRELQKELRSSRERRNAEAQNDTPRNGEAVRIASRRRRSRSLERERREQGERSSSDSSRTDVQRNNLRAFEILCRQLPQTPPLHHRSRFHRPLLQIRLRKPFFRFFLSSKIKSMGLVDSELRDSGLQILHRFMWMFDDVCSVEGFDIFPCLCEVFVPRLSPT
eukprot:Skav212612  [mRNA]  locus=scaffold2176:249477:253407:- [translate_table: standard]